MQILIATPLERHLVDRIAASNASADVLYEPALLPPPLYPSDHRGAPGWTRDARAETRWRELLEGAEVFFGFPGDTGPTLAAALALAPHVRFVQGTAAGAGQQLRAARLSPEQLERISFTSAIGVHGGMLAEFVFYGLLALRKDARRLDRIRTARTWDHYASGELAGSTIAILGMGHIGVAIATVARAFGMRVVGVTRHGTPHPHADVTFAVARLHDAVREADAVVVTLPATASTNGLIDPATFAAMRTNAIFCNVGRGTVIDQAALIAALERGSLAGAVLDVFEPEPLPTDNPLWSMPNVVFSPHTMALSVRENERIVDIFCENLGRFARGETLRNRIDPVEFY